MIILYLGSVKNFLLNNVPDTNDFLSLPTRESKKCVNHTTIFKNSATVISIKVLTFVFYAGDDG